MKKQLLILTIIIALGSTNAVYSKPSEQDTIDFIDTKVKACNKYYSWGSRKTKNGWKYSYSNKGVTSINIYNKMLEIIDEGERSRARDNRTTQITQYKYVSTALLEDLDEQIKAQKVGLERYIILKCSRAESCWSSKRKFRERKNYKSEFSDWNNEPEIKKINMKPNFCDLEVAKKVAKALSHLIKLNGGQAELF